MKLRPAPPYDLLVIADRCPRDPQDAADRYYLARMSPEEAAVFEQHTARCERCAAVSAQVANVVRLVGLAGEAMREKRAWIA